MSLHPAVHNAATCGTNSGYTAHYRNGEAPCQPCKAAHRDYERASQRRRVARRSKALLEDGVTVPAILFAELYLSAPVPLQDQIDLFLGADIVDALIRAHDDYIDMVQKGNAA